jgi:23S rRNA pseudouridine1911/1915/1917 synthase
LVDAKARLYEVPHEARGERLDAHLARAFPMLSRARIQALLAEKSILVDDKAMKPSARVRGGERVKVVIPPPRSAKATPEDLPLRILFEDEELIVLDKAPGMVVHPSAGHWQGTLVNALLHRVKGLPGIGGEARPGIVHRLDKDTSGCLVVAKTERSFLALQKAFKSRRVKKTYLALVHGQPPERGRIETLYGRHPVHRKRFTGRLKEGKPALTEYKVLEPLHGAALVEVALHTGRTHQIRVHLAEAGFPLLGDKLYGGAKRGDARVLAAQGRLGRQALHAFRLGFEHPVRRRLVSFEASVPEDLQRALEALREAPPRA